MTRIERPLSRDAPDIIGAFVLVSLDPVASVAALNDEKATAQAAGVSTGRYFALVKNYLDFQWTEEGPRLTLDFSPGGCGLPSPPDSWAAVPVSPALPKGPCTRLPVDPNVPLPLDNCYLYTLHFTGGTVSRIHQPEHQGPRLSEDGQMYVFTAQYEDRRKIGLAERARLAEEASRIRTPTPEPESPDGPAPAPENNAQTEGFRVAAEAIEYEEDDEQALMEELFQQDGVPRMTPHFEIWLDLSACPPEELGDPAQIQSELDQLERIEWEWAQRTVADIMSKGPETNAWLAGIGEADAPPQSASLDAAFDDGLVAPEDAIEHRMEQGELPPIEVREAMPLNMKGSVAGSQLAQSSTSSIDAFNASDEGQDPPKGQTDGVSPSGVGGLSVFRVVLSSFASFVFRLKSFMWSLIWRRPSAAAP